MRNLYIKQKIISLGEKFTVVDEQQQPVYRVEGSFLKIPKRFKILDNNGNQVGLITKKVISVLPKFFVEVKDRPEVVTITKKLTLLRAKYQIEAKGLAVQGNWWDMDFEVRQGRNLIAAIHKKWISWGDTYELQITDESYEQLIVSLVIAIDRVKADESGSANSNANS
ncbi:LURP-one-related/scramblase family protein [Agrilactobacillus fermenti]|uniref:LURP-one-related/scramblase family protein n=1 Tax=Agrilactobacillus fermenti TaxID=2586909 RepID=UPI001E6428F2|nr:LURP-one-related family protein [Agrilactobacillus fermenti]MCD2256914.1 LURP-one-related family protein [Agrilactobacillus fermenti]